MAEFASAIVGPVVESLLVPVKKHLGYLFLSTGYLRKLDAGTKQLEGTNVDVKSHKDTNDINTLEIPSRLPDWLEDVAKIKTDSETILTNGNGGGCFNIKASIGEDFKSRERAFNDALKFLQQDQKTQAMALCGMGGVGKTTMMLQLKKVAEEKKMFDWIVKVDIGTQPNWHSIQQAVAENLGKPFKEEAETTWADRLRTRFEETLKKSEKGILVILDDVWEKVELGYVGLSPLPNGVKLLLTSRNEVFCNIIAVREGTLRCLRSNDPDLSVQESIRISYDYLKDEDKEIFLLCGLFPEDSSIPIEDLIRYAWGLKLLMRAPTFRDGGYRIIRCVSNLRKANLLIDGGTDCVKMHDLVLAFVLATVRTGDHDSFINHGDLSKAKSITLTSGRIFRIQHHVISISKPDLQQPPPTTAVCRRRPSLSAILDHRCPPSPTTTLCCRR
ncbi:hypothetical protein OSB04_028575 [Centaurea solstitialis]|uniref:NB-ARC domain-containing protein n=1 Tax=Centaurea solstitialis TaxID=347529 RepID=A0AA38SFV1_9ASTR|nr:hypothetical protein OSB04_028575 [Centaurea solstitialis]